jgi:hypothetical protein
VVNESIVGAEDLTAGPLAAYDQDFRELRTFHSATTRSFGHQWLILLLLDAERLTMTPPSPPNGCLFSIV